MDEEADFRGMTADIVSAYVGSRNHVQASELPALIRAVHDALTGTMTVEPAAPEKPVPAVPLRRAVTPDAVTCLFDGRKFKSLKRHLQTDHDMTPAQYRETFGLPKDSPMVAPNYAQARSELAKKMGLGAGGRGRSIARPAATGRDAPAPRDDIAPVAPPKRRGRPPKA